MRKKVSLILIIVLITMISLVGCSKVDISDIEGRYEMSNVNMASEESQLKILASSFAYFEVIIKGKSLSIHYKFTDAFYKTLTEAQPASYELSTKNYKYTANDNTITVAEGALKGVYYHKRGLITGRISILDIPCDFVCVIVKK